jgi:hypothetical protein
MASALSSLHEPSQQALLNATIALITEGHEQADAALRKLATLSPVMRAGAQATLADVPPTTSSPTRS